MTRPLILAATLIVLASACTEEGPGPPPEPPPGSRTVEEMAGALGGDVLEHLRRGYRPDMSTDVAFVPAPSNVVVRWSGEGLGTDLADPRTTHPTPWDYHQRVPISLYGPGFVREGLRVDRPVDIADLAPTFARLVETEFDAPDGEPLHEALLPAQDAPRVVVLVAYDGGGWNLLEQWPNAWPELRGLLDRGTTYTNATIGSAPSVTSAIHANMGTGTYPRTHGIAEINGRLPDGSVGDVFFDEETDPRLLRSPTFGDVWDRRQGNRPWVGMIGYESWHLGMMSRGTRSPGGDRDVAVLWAREPGIGELFVNEEFYELPDHIPDEAALHQHLTELDTDDGAIDGAWHGYDLADPAVVPATPAFVRYQGDVLVQLVENEPLGTDGITDLLSVELKPTDFGGHLWNMVAPEEEEVLRAQDQVLRRLVAALDRKVGRGRWVMAFTADHGQTPKPETTGGLRIHPDVLSRNVEEYFGTDIVQTVTPSGMFLDGARMEEAGITVDDVARYVGDYRYGDGLPADVDRSTIPEAALQERVFAAALPGPFIGSLTDGDVEAAGTGDYPEGDLTSAVRVPYP
ncbi:MAG: alkaline phosphatase family protein [Actinomycetota bacterium]